MMRRPQLICATATPLRADRTCQRQLLLAHCRDLLGRGCDGIALFGTTGEGPYLRADDRRATLKFLLGQGVAPASLIVSSTSRNLFDVVELTHNALSGGVTRVLLMPSCPFRPFATEENAYRYYVDVVERIADQRLRLLLYHFPEISGVGLSVGLIRRLRDALGEVVVGIKDSGGDWDQTRAFLEAFPDLEVYTGTEIHARRAVAGGAAGTICGLANVIPRALRRFLDAPEEGANLWQAWIQAVDAALSAGPFVPACKAAIALASGDDDWRRVRDDDGALDDEAFDQLAETLRGLVDRHRQPLA